MAYSRKEARRPRALGMALLALSLALGASARLVLPPAPGRAPWEGFRTLLVDSSSSEPEVLSRLRAAGLKDLLSESTEPVLVSDWGGLETLSLAEARVRLLPGDPRLDSYISSLGLWFKAKRGGIEYRAYYIKEGLWPAAEAALERRVALAMKGLEGKFVLPDTGARPAAADPATAACAILILIIASSIGPIAGMRSRYRSCSVLRAPKARALTRLALRLSMAAPWAVLACAGGGRTVIAAIWGIMVVEAADSLDLPLEELRGQGGRAGALRSLALQPLPSPALALMALVAVAILPGSLISIALALLGSTFAVIGCALAGYARAERPAFIPLPIAAHRSPWASFRSGSGSLRALLAFALALAWFMGGFSASGADPSAATGIVRPLPERGPGSPALTLDAARNLAPAEAGGDILPGLASFLVHKATEEALPYERVGEPRDDAFAPAPMPMPADASAEVPGDGGKDFGEAWARASLASVPPLSLEGMLMRQGQDVVGKTSAGGPRKGGPLAPIDSLLYIILLVPPVGRMLVGLPKAKGAARGELRQEA